ncbi:MULTISPECIES: uroporphyrinogen-III synthase [Roseivirga]|jgi:uroporphyrinogen-III synthase|uniref:Uroporphyrinogen-III synthase n=1 Tax=Roseivirga spongicola TaxID=333140 RepID=A0A150XHA5_9BACT|nr:MULTISPECIES: uroporphyrinogen-III synthase [Roseivirga]KYG78089.1 uroporphyrinogen-III synthase [Roseivirga spongicola]MBO6497501.1 uroporphyrinogen-III synthase [Roseivirga sp.]PWL30824.1 MAG: uroporphyrinogen-III synthase [Roseivirga sp. XM-24bin3]WPZ11826.1 uroporphyrinogen-III synthase [Roseivirga spongicola]
MSNSTSEERLKPVKSILVSQPKPSDPKSPYYSLAKKYGIKIDFRPFIQVDPIAAKEFRKQKIDILKHTAIIFTSRNAVDHFFAICKDLKIEVPADMKYFCISEQTAYYLQKYIVVRKRKIFTGSKTAQDLIEILKKHKNEKYLFPCSNIRKEDIPNYLEKNGYNFSEAVIYETVASDLSDLDDVTYDILAFYSPSGINSLFVNFPEFKQNDTRIAVFGPTTAQAAKEASLEIDIEAPQPNAPSMTGALELYIKKANNL